MKCPTLRILRTWNSERGLSRVDGVTLLHRWHLTERCFAAGKSDVDNHLVPSLAFSLWVNHCKHLGQTLDCARLGVHEALELLN